ncbi:hypothetical protein AAKU55_003514 [Oxalobacteraceae bacterium GrIS 1.11]
MLKPHSLEKIIPTICIRTLLGLALAASAALAQAGISTFDNRAVFDAQGRIAYNSNFDDFGRAYHFPGADFTRGDVSYVSDENLIVGAGTPFSVGAQRPVMSNEYWTPLAARVAAGYSLLGFDAAVTSGPVEITLETNLGNYHFGAVTLPDGATAFGFKGFRTTGAGEYFTGFQLAAQGSGHLLGVTDVAVGMTPVPEPSRGALLLLGMTAMAWVNRRR